MARALWLAVALVLAGCGGASSSFTANDKAVNISITADGKISWNDELVSMDEMRRRLKLEAARSPQPDVHVVPDKLARYKDVSDVMLEVQSAGLAKRGMVGGT